MADYMGQHHGWHFFVSQPAAAEEMTTTILGASVCTARRRPRRWPTGVLNLRIGAVRTATCAAEYGRPVRDATPGLRTRLPDLLSPRHLIRRVSPQRTVAIALGVPYRPCGSARFMSTDVMSPALWRHYKHSFRHAKYRMNPTKVVPQRYRLALEGSGSRRPDVRRRLVSDVPRDRYRIRSELCARPACARPCAHVRASCSPGSAGNRDQLRARL